MTDKEEFEAILEQIDENADPPLREPQRQYYFIKKLRTLIKKKSEELGRPLFSTIKTFGCQMHLKSEIA